MTPITAPLQIREATPEECKRDLKVGIAALTRLVAEIDHDLDMLLRLLSIAEQVDAVASPAALDNHQTRLAWDRGIELLATTFAEGGTTRLDLLGKLAIQAEKIGVITGHSIYAAGGEVSDGDFVLADPKFLKARDR